MSHYQIKRLWNATVPILRTNLVATQIVNASFNQALTQVAVGAFDNFTIGGSAHKNNSTAKRRRRKQSRSDSTNDDMLSELTPANQTPNDNFFEYQRTHGYRLAFASISSCKSVQHLEQEICYDASIHYLQKAFNTNEATTRLSSMSGEVSIDLWAAVQRGKRAHHAFHVHEGAIVSGVYYSACPEGCAPLVLRKPIANRESIDNATKDKDDVSIHPKEGDLILFPPWLEHGVPKQANETTSAAASDMPRVSWAFNMTARAVGIDNHWDIIL
jgi:uncharacterized protein (TIGR02466 family)